MHFVYGGFVSNEGAPPGTAIREIGKNSPPRDIQGEESEGSGPQDGACFSLLRNGQEAGRFFYSRTGSYLNNGRSFTLGEKTACIYGISGTIAPPSMPPWAYAALNGFASNLGAGRIIIFAKSPLADDIIRAAGVCLVGASSDASAGRFPLNCGKPKPFKDARGFLRSHLPTASAKAYRLMQKLSRRRFQLNGFFRGMPVRALFFGPKDLSRFFSAIMFDSFREPIQAGVLPWARGDLDKEDAELSMEVSGQTEIPVAENALRMPIMIRSLLPLTATFEDYVSGLQNSALSDISKIRKSGFRAEISRDPLDFAIFYYSMHLPMLDRRHHGYSIILDYHEAESIFRDGFLLFAMKGNAPMGGMLMYEREGRLTMKILGTARGSFEVTRSGINAALIYFSIKHGFDSGFRLIDMGLSGPFASDGLVLFKKKWGAIPASDKGADSMLIRFRNSQARTAFEERYRPYIIGRVEEVEPPWQP